MKSLLFLTLCLALAFGDPIQITASSDKVALAQALFPAGVATIDVSSITLVGTTDQSGFFDKGTESIGIEKGILLTSGTAINAKGPNSAPSTTGSIGDTTQDPDVTSQLGITNIRDRNALSFSFTTGGAPLSFRYVFGSEEYPEYVNSNFNDVFAFFLDGVNVATLPGTTTPVRINNVNAGLNADYFVTNDVAASSSFNQIQYDGFTKGLYVALCLAPGAHTFKFLVADVADNILDSGVFIETATTYYWTTNPADFVFGTTLELPCGTPLPAAPSVYVSSPCNDLQEITPVETHPELNTVVRSWTYLTETRTQTFKFLNCKTCVDGSLVLINGTQVTADPTCLAQYPAGCASSTSLRDGFNADCKAAGYAGIAVLANGEVGPTSSFAANAVLGSFTVAFEGGWNRDTYGDQAMVYTKGGAINAYSPYYWGHSPLINNPAVICRC